MVKFRLPRPAGGIVGEGPSAEGRQHRRRGAPESISGWFGVCLIFVTSAIGWKASGQSLSNSHAAHPVLLRLRTGALDPTRAAAITGSGRSGAGSGTVAVTSASRGLYLVQFQGPVRREWRQALEAAGAAIIDYVPDFAYLVRAAPAAAARFAALPGYRWHGTFDTVRRQLSDAGPGIIGAASTQAAGRGATLRLDVMTYPGEDLQALARRLPGRVLQRSSRGRGFLRVQVTPEEAARVAAVPGVAWVEPYAPPVLLNDVAAGIMRVPAARDDLGLFGRGQVVAVADTGLDVGGYERVSPDFRGRVRHAYALNRSSTGDWSDLYGHGTHVCGSVLGAGILSGADPANHQYDGSFAGMAPEASLVMQSIGGSNGTLSLPTDVEQLLLGPYQNDGVRVHSDSWGTNSTGTTGQYLLQSWQIDDACWQARDLVVVFAAGNSGTDANGDGVVDLNSLSPQATAKNAITVGASENVRDQSMTWGNFPAFPSDPVQGSRMAENAGGMAAFSSRGPTADGRFKPDIVAPGTWILSARSHAFGATALWGPYNADYAYSGGTSMSAPLVGGAAALVREGLQERFGLASPSSALVKALMINGADELAPGQYGTGPAREIPPRPNPVEGWGRVNVRQSFGSAGARTVLPIDDAAGLQTEDRRKYTVTVLPGKEPLRITLAWTDPPSSLLAGPQLVNDLDLKLYTPDGQWLYGNGGSDRLNNVEGIELSQPAPGLYTVVVDGYNVPKGPQPFALAVSGPIQPPAATGLRGWLHAAGSDLPLAGADVTVVGSRTLALTTNAAGRIECQLPAGSYTLTPAKPGWNFDPPSRSVTVTDGQMLSVEFAATAPPGTLSGTLTDPNGGPVAGARVTLSPGDQAAVTAADGTYRFAALPPLMYTVAPSLAGTAFTPDSQRVRVPAAGGARADFTIATAAVSGTVVTAGPAERQMIASGHPVRTPGAQSWTVSRPGARWIRVHFSRIEAQPGAEKLEVFDAAGRLASRWTGVFTDVWSRWAEGSSLTIRYTASGYYARYGFDSDLVQSDLGGRPLGSAAISLQPGGRATQTDGGGSFRFSALSGASFSVAPALNGWEFFPAAAVVTVPAGGSEGVVNFLAQGPPSVSGRILAAGTVQAARFESLHPYANGTSRVQEISVPGASRLRLHFARLATEFGADVVRLLGPDGGELKRLSGARTDFWTDWLPSGRVTVRFDSDDSLNDWGYLIDAVTSDVGAAGPVAGATVTLSPGGASVTTAADGTYRLSDLVPGGYTITASGSGLQFTPSTLPVTVPVWGVSGADLEASRVDSTTSPAIVAAVSPDGRPQVRGFAAGGWSPLPDPGSLRPDRLLALQGINGRPELIALASGRLFHSRLTAGAWTAWQSLPGPGSDRAPLAAAELDGTLDLLAVAPSGAVLQYRFVNGIWQEPVPAAGVPAWDGDRAALVARGNGTLDLVGVGADGRLLHSRFLNGGWSTLGPVFNRTVALRPALVIGTDAPSASATLELAFVADDGSVMHERFRNGAWEGLRALRSAAGFLAATGSPALAAGPDARLELVIPTTDGLYHGRAMAGSWSWAYRVDGADARAVALALLPQINPPSALELFATAGDGTVTHLRYRGGLWTSPAPLAGLLTLGSASPATR